MQNVEPMRTHQHPPAFTAAGGYAPIYAPCKTGRSEDPRPRRPRRLRKLDPRTDGAQPGDVHGRGGGDPDDGALHPRPRHRQPAVWAFPSRSISGSGSRCCSPTSPKPSPRAAARPRPRRLRKAKTETRRQAARRRRSGTKWQSVPATQLQAGRRRAGRGGRPHPVRRRGDRGRRLGQRSRDHRRIGAGDPRERRRPLGGDRRHAGDLRLDQGAHHGRSKGRPSSIA